jgi:ubiquitin carboxyl-terminal hydrolase 4/11/15
MREIKTHSSYSYYGGQKYTTYGQVFGLPIVVTVPRKGCTYKTLYDIICKQISRYTLGGEQEQEMEKVIENDDSQEPVEEMECEVTVEPEPSDDTSAVSKEVTPPVDNEEELTSESSSAKGQEDEGSAAVNEQQKDKNNDKMDADKQEMFKMVIVNSYGSQEVQKLTANSAQTLKLTSQTYIACDWDSDVKEKCYDISKADTYEEHESCKASKEEKKVITLLDCMNLFVQNETLGEEDAWFCPHCKDFVQASKKFDLWKMPEILVIHLKRFSYSRYYRNKIETRVDFPLQDLDLTNYVINPDEPQPLYDLFAVSNHYGGLGGGHYTAYAKNKSTGKWHSFDDSHVSSVEADPKMICSSASYVLFYQRRTEGKRVPQVNRSLSVSFDEEVKEGQKKFHKGQVTQSMDVGSNKIEEEEEENNEDSAIEDDTQREEMKDIEKITGTENDD